jgi:two-component system sensor histidine kinase KdpD
VRRGLVEPQLRAVVVAGVSGSGEDERVIRDACLLARQDDADLLVVHVNVLDGSSSRRQRQTLDRNRELASELGGSYIEVEGNSPAPVLADIARARGASRVVVASRPPRLGLLSRFSFGAQLRRLLPQVTVDEVRASPSPAR